MENGQRKKRGRPPGSRKTTSTSEQNGSVRRDEYRATASHQKPLSPGSPSLDAKEINEEQLAYELADEKLTPFSSLLRNILRRDRAEIVRTAKELDVAENTIYRWMNGNSEPRLMHLKRLPEVLTEHRGTLSYVINQTFPGVLDTLPTGIREVGKDIYRIVLELVATISEEDTRLWEACKVLFEYMLLHLDAERLGMGVTYAQLMPPREDGNHSLRETAMRGSPPWPFDSETKAYLGSTTLAGAAVMMQRPLIWNKDGGGDRLPVEVDEHEVSACAAPITRGNRIAGALIVSSAEVTFFNDPLGTSVVLEYAQLLATALPDANFYPYSQLNLRPMPPLKVQREQITRSYVSRILAHARKQNISRIVATQLVHEEMEKEFEDLVRAYPPSADEEPAQDKVKP